MGGLGKNSKGAFMYHYVTDKEFLTAVRSATSDAVNRLVNGLNNMEGWHVGFRLIGSGGRNMPTQNENEPIDLDYNLVLEMVPNIHDCHAIKETVRKTFNLVLRGLIWGDCSDSTSALTTQKMRFSSKNKTQASIDLGIVVQDDKDNWWRLIHKKTGRTATDSWVWEKVRDSKGLETREKWLKENGFWNDVRQTYLDKKNLYLKRQETDTHPSFICYIEAVNEEYSKH